MGPFEGSHVPFTLGGVTRPIFDEPPPYAIAHRGSRVLWPENTLTAFRGAVELGFRWLETDLHQTRDGTIVCIHDDTVDRTTDGTGRVADLTLAEVKALDAGYRFRRDHDHPFRGRGVRVPTLEEVVSEFSDVKLVVDLKQDGMERGLADLITRFDLWDRLIVGSFSGERLARFRRETDGRVATSTGPKETFRVWLRSWIGAPPHVADALQVPRFYWGLPVVTKRTVAAAHRAGMQVHVWTVNEPDVMGELLDWGVDGLITDRPDLLKTVLEGRGIWQGA